MAQSPLWGCSQEAGQNFSQLKLCGVRFQAPSCGYHQEASVLYYVSLSTGLLNNTWILQSKWSKTQCDQDGSCSIFYNLILKVPYHHFCYIYWSHKPTLAQCGKEVDKLMNLRSWGSIGLSWRLTTQFWVFSFSSLSACSCFKLLPYSLTTKSKIPGFVCWFTERTLRSEVNLHALNQFQQYSVLSFSLFCIAPLIRGYLKDRIGHSQIFWFRVKSHQNHQNSCPARYVCVCVCVCRCRCLW